MLASAPEDSKHPPATPMLLDSIDTVDMAAWNRLAGAETPFLRHEFLAALEHQGCVGAELGWAPQHLILRAGDGGLIGAVPMYLKTHSWGEFVFDWTWADASAQLGRPYYPKLVAGIPHTPATGPRLLTGAQDPENITTRLIDEAQQNARARGVSSLHWLFTTPDETAHLQNAGFIRRMGCQFHWENRGYRDFDDFLSTFTAERRKKLKRERRRVSEAGLTLDVLHGHEIGVAQWRAFYHFYLDTFARHGQPAPLTLSFFHEIATALPQSVVLTLARHGAHYVAGALCFRGKDTLYGRYWGCARDFHSLHFETCYYQGIDYCIRHGLRRFEPGAQGEHKVPRGFEPTATWSAHWIADPRLRAAVSDFCTREEQAIAHYMEKLRLHLPYKTAAP